MSVWTRQKRSMWLINWHLKFHGIETYTHRYVDGLHVGILIEMNALIGTMNESRSIVSQIDTRIS